jgi:hypothetical protein
VESGKVLMITSRKHHTKWICGCPVSSTHGPIPGC